MTKSILPSVTTQTFPTTSKAVAKCRFHRTFKATKVHVSVSPMFSFVLASLSIQLRSLLRECLLFVFPSLAFSVLYTTTHCTVHHHACTWAWHGVAAWAHATYRYHVTWMDTVGWSVEAHVPVDYASVGLAQACPKSPISTPKDILNRHSASLPWLCFLVKAGLCT